MTGHLLPAIPAEATATEARLRLENAGWREIAQGDWSWVFAAPDDRLVARVTPFDPAFHLFAESCLAGPPNRFLVRIDALVPLCRKGYVTLMERLYPPVEAQAHRLAASLGIADQTGAAIPDGTPADLAGDPDIVALRHRLRDLLGEGARRFRLWGGADIRPGNTLQTAEGQPKLTDPVFIRGRDILAAIVDARPERLADFTRADLQDFLTIPVFPPGPDTDALRASLDALRLASDA